MAYNNGRENRKWLRWKETEEKILRECGVDEATIEQIRTDDRAEFNSDRRYYSRKREVGSCLEDMAESGQDKEVNTVADLLDEIENENLYQSVSSFLYYTTSLLHKKMSRKNSMDNGRNTPQYEKYPQHQIYCYKADYRRNKG